MPHLLQWDDHEQTCPGKLKPCPLAEYGCPNKELVCLVLNAFWLHFYIVSLMMALSCADVTKRIAEASPAGECSSCTDFGGLVQDYEAAVPTATGAIHFSQIHGFRLWLNG